MMPDHPPANGEIKSVVKVMKVGTRQDNERDGKAEDSGDLERAGMFHGERGRLINPRSPEHFPKFRSHPEIARARRPRH